MRTKWIAWLCIFLLFACAVLAQTMVKVGHFVKVNTATDPPVALTNSPLKVRRVTFVGRKADRTDNTGIVWVGMVSNNNVQATKILAGESISPLIPDGTFMDLSQWYLDVETANDGVLIFYE